MTLISSTEDKKCVSLVTECKKPDPPSPSSPPPPKTVPTLPIFIGLCVVLVVVIHLLFDYGCSKECILCVAVGGVIVSILICLGIKFYVYQHNIANNKDMQKLAAIWRTIGYIFVIHVLIGLSVFYYFRCRFFPCGEANANGPETANSPETMVEYINRRLSLLKVESSTLKFCQPARLSNPPVLAVQPRSQFVVSVKDNSQIPFYLFQATEYTLDTGWFRAAAPGQICRYIDNCYDEKDPILESLRKNQAGVSTKGCLNVPVPEVTTELGYIFRKLSKLPCARIEILIRGYADGGSGWEMWLKPGRYAYHDFRIYRRYKHEESGYFEDLYYSGMYHVDDFYSNKDLPNLRAMFVKQDLIEPIISQCNMLPGVAAYVIDGQELPGLDPLNRKVQIYILLF